VLVLRVAGRDVADRHLPARRGAVVVAVVVVLVVRAQPGVLVLVDALEHVLERVPLLAAERRRSSPRSRPQVHVARLEVERATRRRHDEQEGE
jgi:hypothetical protein